MPAATTHVEFAKDVLKTFPQFQAAIRNRQMFYLGSQGPDMLFFSHASIFPGSLHKYGSLMHGSKVYDVISFFENYAKDDFDLNSYIKGYLCHYALDSTAHPLIFAVTDAMVKQHGGRTGVTHVGLEAEIDVWMLQQRGRQANDYDVFHYLKVTDSDQKKLASMYHEMFLHVYDLDIKTTTIAHAIDEVYTWTKFLYPKKSTYQFIYAFETAVGGIHGLTAMMLYNKSPKEIINTEHISYTIPWAPYEKIQSSFLELYDKALPLAASLLTTHKKDDFQKNFNGENVNKAMQQA